jgi:hypothetical protein
MTKSYLKQMLSYFSKVYQLGEKIKRLKDGRLSPQIETSTISFIVLFAFICRLRSFNRLEHWLEKGRFKNLFPKKTRLPHIDAIRRSLSSFDIDSLHDMHDHIIKTIFKNKVFRNGTIDDIKVAAIDGVEMTGMDMKVRFIRFVEEIYDVEDKKESKEVWIVTTNKSICAETLWKIIHKRWDIENNVFHQLKTECHFDHCYLHSPTGIEATVGFMIIAFNLTQLYFFRNIRGFRKKDFLQIDIIEDLKDEMLLIKDWGNPIFNSA